MTGVGVLVRLYSDRGVGFRLLRKLYALFAGYAETAAVGRVTCGVLLDASIGQISLFQVKGERRQCSEWRSKREAPKTHGKLTMRREPLQSGGNVQRGKESRLPDGLVEQN